VLRNSPLQSCNTLALEARADAMARVADKEQLLAALAWATEHGLPVIPLGEGSNIVFAGDQRALVLRVETRGIEVLDDSADHTLLRVAAGENWHCLVRQTLRQGCYGLENLALIPGTVGAAPIQNIGAYGVELASFVVTVHCLNIADGSSLSLSAAECRFGYRDSVFKRDLRDRLVITEVDLRLSRRSSPRLDYPALAQAVERQQLAEVTPEDVYRAVVSIRRSKLPDPVREPNAGSFFKNPTIEEGLARELSKQFPGMPVYPQPGGRAKLAAGWLIEQCGWKGYRQDRLGVHPEHALVIVNYGNNSGTRLLALADEIAHSVQARFGIALETEPRIYGRWR
jgi:UDP-N-acetylmuramate dehydrogenase